jgi:RHS repeat-associated protein
MYLDALGRTFYSIADNGVQGSYATHTELDILGKPLSVTDARGHVVMSTVYNALSVPCKTESMDAGERKTLLAVDGLPVLGFDSRSHRLRNEYDALRRPTNQWLSESGAAEKLVGKTIYGESATSPEAYNLRGKLWKSYDQSGLVVNTSYDFKGNLLESTRQFTQVYNATIDWNIAEPDTLLESETFTTITAYDALNRAISIKTPHNANIPASEVLPSYNEASLLERVDVKLRGAITATNFVNNIDYNAKGQRERIQYGNGSTTGYTYDEKTFRLKRLLTTRNNGADTLQDLNYTYDPVGNITQIDDNAQQTIYFNGSVVSPSQKFEYDALYRLLKSTGREHISINASSEPEAEGYNPAQISPQDGSAMRNYVREWQYDSVGNILSLIHNANGNAWTRSYDYASDSNRVNSTTVGQTTVNYTYNAHGSMISMPHLQGMQWDFAEKLSHITRGTIEAYYNYDGGGQRVRKVVEKNGIVETRLYLGGFEIWRKSVNGVLETERETLHVMDDKKRVAIVETLTIDNAIAVANPVPVQRYQLDNHLASASLELDDSANIVSYEEYYPYGETSYQAGRTASEVSQKRYRYTGKEKDEESGLYYHGARYYACWLGRWTASDPAGLVDGVNLYMYVRGNPVRLSDNDGKRSGPSPDHDVLGQLTGGPIDSTCTFNCGRSINEESFSGGKDPQIESTRKQTQSVKSKDEEQIEFNSKKGYKETVEELTEIINAIGQNDLTIEQKKIIADIPNPHIFLLLAKDAYTRGREYLSDPRNRAQVEGFAQLRMETKRDPKHNEFYITGHTGKIKNLNPKIGVISDGGQKSVKPQYDPQDIVLFHSHPDESPLSFNGLFVELDGKEYFQGRGGDLGASAASGKSIFAITPSGDIYYTTPELAWFGITHSGKSSKFFGTGKLGQVYLGNIKQYIRSKK